MLITVRTLGKCGFGALDLRLVSGCMFSHARARRIWFCELSPIALYQTSSQVLQQVVTGKMTWQELKASNGSVYYYNSTTQESVREKPLELYTQMDHYLHKTDWRQHTADNGKTYYYNIKSRQSIWEIPEDVKKLIDSDTKEEEEESKSEEVKTEETNQGYTAGGLTDSKEKYHNQSKLLQLRPVKGSQEAETIFVQMLREEGVDSTWSFSKVVDFFIADPRYWLIEDSLHKKQVFESYLQNRTKDELMKENQSVEKFKSAFLKLLKSCDDIKHYTRWKTVKLLIQDEPIYAHSVISEKVKRAAYQEYVDSLRKEHDAKEQQQRDVALGELKEYFKTMNLSLQSTWDSTIKSIREDKRFAQNKHFEVLNQLDLITLFEDNIVELQNDYKVRLKDQSRLNYRQDRRARDGFRELLSELKETGLLRADTKWEDVYSLIAEDDRFVELLGRNGSTPVELFDDFVEEEELLIRAKKGIVDQVLLHHNFFLKDDVELDAQKLEIKTILEKDDQTKEFDDDTIDLVYERLLKDVAEQRRKDAIEKERKLRRHQDDFRHMLRGLTDPGVDENSKWDEFKAKLEATKEYLALPDEETRKEAFEKYVKRFADQKKEAEMRKEEEVKRIIASATNARRDINEKKRPITAVEPAEELDY